MRRAIVDPEHSDTSPVIVGIGASAGGLEALEQFFRHLPAKTGLAFVVVQHLDPSHSGMLVELLQRATLLKVVQIKDRMKVAADRVHVIPPNSDLSLLHGVLHLLPPVEARGLRLPIDYFFRSLAADQLGRAIGVVLSGMGSDGTLGLRAIKERGGTVFVQSPASAKFDAMPRSAIDTGVVDVVAPVEELAARIVAFRAHSPSRSRADPALTPRTHSAIEKICLLIRNQTGQDFSQYKRSTIYRRIERRMGLHQVSNIAAYVRYLQQSPQETTLLFKEFLIGVTRFFRDAPTWEELRKKALPELLEGRPNGGILRAWVAGCSTGEEAYSLAILFKELVGPTARHSLQVFATDLDKDAIDRARIGLYPASIAGDVSPERLKRFFVKDPGGYRVGIEIREMVIFATQNLAMDPPFTKLDLLCCRNLLIYLEPELQKKLLPLFHYSLNPGGILLLGSAESLGPAADLFVAVSARTRIFRRRGARLRNEPVEFPSAFQPRESREAPTTRTMPSTNLNTLMERLLLDRYAPAAVLTNEKGDLLYISGHTGKYLEPAAGKANWNLHAMARDGLREELGSAFLRAVRSKKPNVRARLQLDDAGTQESVDVTIEPLHAPSALRGLVMVVFKDAPRAVEPPPAGKAQSAAATARMVQELLRAREDLQTTREDMQTSQEELRSANEELQSTNEELQSTNEELMTSKEEMQSLNEELQTLNHELQSKVDELSHANDDMRNLLDSTDIATLFLDEHLRIRRFTAQMTKLVKLIPGDLNRPITDLASELLYPQLEEDARGVLQTLVFKETPVRARNKRWYAVRIMPYRTLENRISGVVITFVDISSAKELEERLRQTQPATRDST